MQLAKLLDPKETGTGKGAKTNLSLNRLQHDLKPFSEETNIKLQEYLNEINKNSESILEHRKKRIAHNDLENKLDYQLPSVEIRKIRIIIDVLEDAFNLISINKTGRDYKFLPIKATDNDKPEYLVKILTHGRSILNE